MSRLKRFLLLALLLVLSLAPASCGGGSSTGASLRAPTQTVPGLSLPGGPMVSMSLFGNTYPYYLRHTTGTSEGLARSSDQNWWRVSGWVDTQKFHSLNPGAHFSLNLRNNTSIRDADKPDPSDTGAVTLGHGVIFGNVTDDHKFRAVVEQFDKTPGAPILLPSTASPELPDTGRFWYSVVSRRDKSSMSIRYGLWDMNGSPVYLSNWTQTQHSQPLDGDDLTRGIIFLGPDSKGDFTPGSSLVYEPAVSAWSTSPLEPVPPASPEDAQP